MKNAVTGSSGFIAGHLIRALLERGDDVYAVDKRKPSIHIEKLFSKYQKQLTVILCKGLSPMACKQLVNNVQVVYHLAAETNLKESVNRPWNSIRDDLLSTVNMLNACKELSPLSRFVFTSSAAVYGQNSKDKVSEEDAEGAEVISPYGANKKASEMYACLYSKVHGLSTVCLRLFNVYGPGQLNLQAAIPSFTLNMLRGEHLKVRGDGFQTRDFIHVSDVVKALLLVGSNNRTGVYNVGTGTAYSLMDLIMYLAAHTENKFYVDNLPKLEWDIQHSCANISRIESEMGWEPEMGLEDGVVDTVEYYKQI